MYEKCLLCGISTGTFDALCISCREKELIRMNESKECKNRCSLPESVRSQLEITVYQKMSNLIEYQDNLIISLENELKALRVITDAIMDAKGFIK
jgi:hypothetical protein